MRPEQSELNVRNCNCIIVLHMYTSIISVIVTVVYMHDLWLACACYCSRVMAHLYSVILCYAWLVLYHVYLRMPS